MGDSIFNRDRIDYEVDTIKENLESFDHVPGLRPIQKASDTALRNVAKWKLQDEKRKQRIADEKLTKKRIVEARGSFKNNPFENLKV